MTHQGCKSQWDSEWTCVQALKKSQEASPATNQSFKKKKKISTGSSTELPGAPELLPSLCWIGVCTFGAPFLSLLYISFHSGLLSPRPHSHSLIPEPCAPLQLRPPSSEALGICFLTARGCTLIHLYHRKQKTSLTSHLFHRWESNSLLNDCPEPTIQRGGIYSAGKDRGALL